MKTNFTEQDSLKLINEMIVQARSNFQKGAGNDFIFAGYCVALVALTNFVLLHTLPSPHQSYWLWLLMFPMQIGFKIFDNKRRRNETYVKTHIDSIISSIWATFGYSIIVLLILVFGTAYTTQKAAPLLMITPIILLLMGFAQFITAKASRFIHYHYAAFVFWGGALLCVGSCFLNLYDAQFLVLAACMLLGFVLPGRIANKKPNRDV